MNRNAKILIVEDEAVFVMSLERELELSGYRLCEPVSTGDEAVEKVKKDDPDVVLLDLCLRCGIDGFDTAKRIRSISNSPIIFMSGYQEEEAEEDVKAVKGSVFLPKPFSPETLIKTIEISLEKHGMGRIAQTREKPH